MNFFGRQGGCLLKMGAYSNIYGVTFLHKVNLS